MLESALTKLKEIYENVLDNQIDTNEFLHGNLIEKLHIDSLIALQIIVEIEKRFDFIIEDDETAIKVVDSPSFFLDAFQKNNIEESL